MALVKSSDKICVAGLPGSGKTVWARWLASQVEPNVFVIDPLDQYKQIPIEKRFVPGSDGKPMTLLEEANEVEAIAKRFHSVGNTTLIIEEAEQYISQQKQMGPYMTSLIRKGRNWGVGVWLTTRRIQDINKTFFDLCQHVFLFRPGWKSRTYIAELIGKEFVYENYRTKVGSLNKTGYTITTLKDYHCIHFNLENESATVRHLNLPGRAHVEEVGTVSQSPGKGKIEEIQGEKVGSLAQQIKDNKEKENRERRSMEELGEEAISNKRKV